MKIKFNYTLRYKENNSYCNTIHTEITEEDLLNCLKKLHKPSDDRLFIDGDIEIEGFSI